MPPRRRGTPKTRLLALVLATLAAGSARAGEAAQEAAKHVAADLRAVDAVEIRGVRRTRPATVMGLLPRDVPTVFTPEDLEELDRRLNNLGIFDAVAVRIEGRRLVIELREKWTLIPDLDLTTGRTLRDTYVALGVTEYNVAGAAMAVGASASWEQRGLNGSITWAQHEYSPRSGALSGEAGYESASLRFVSGDAWYRDQAGGWLAWQPPFRYGAPVRGKLGVLAFHERVSRQEGSVSPPSGVVLGVEAEISRDRYTWRDLAPSGTHLSLGAAGGAFVPADQARVYGTTRALGAISPTETTAFLGQLVIEVVNPGNVNHSLLLSSQNGVRGLADAFYRNQAQLVVNLEARQAWRFAERWALQAAAFVDAAAFAPLDAEGRRQPGLRAFAVGGGVRLVPTWLAEIVVRVDAGRLFAPEARWFLQVGLAQYF